MSLAKAESIRHRAIYLGTLRSGNCLFHHRFIELKLGMPPRRSDQFSRFGIQPTFMSEHRFKAPTYSASGF
jgi:hypothetical protein